MSPVCQLEMTLPWKTFAAEMAARYGAETAVLDRRERLVCSGCGSRQVDKLLTGTCLRRKWQVSGPGPKADL